MNVSIDDEMRALIRSLLLTVANSWKDDLYFGTWWQANYSWVREDLDEDETPHIDWDQLHATLGSIARSCGIRSESHWDEALARWKAQGAQ